MTFAVCNELLQWLFQFAVKLQHNPETKREFKIILNVPIVLIIKLIQLWRNYHKGASETQKRKTRVRRDYDDANLCLRLICKQGKALAVSSHAASYVYSVRNKPSRDWTLWECSCRLSASFRIERFGKGECSLRMLASFETNTKTYLARVG